VSTLSYLKCYYDWGGEVGFREKSGAVEAPKARGIFDTLVWLRLKTKRWRLLGPLFFFNFSLLWTTTSKRRQTLTANPMANQQGKLVLRRSEDRGKSDEGWLKSYHSFSYVSVLHHSLQALSRRGSGGLFVMS
jgi:hypothetical protein